eukprot:3603701-Rhodomonas_salina.1
MATSALSAERAGLPAGKDSLRQNALGTPPLSPPLSSKHGPRWRRQGRESACERGEEEPRA